MRNRARNQWLLEQHVYKHRREKRRKKLRRAVQNVSVNKYRIDVHRYFTILFRFWNAKGYINEKYCRSVIYAPKKFSFKSDFDGSIVFFKELISTYFLREGNLSIDFSKCEQASVANFSLLEIIMSEIVEVKEAYNRGRYEHCDKRIKVIRSTKDVKTNKYLHSFMGVKLPENQNDGSFYNKKSLIRQKQRTLKENPKALVSHEMVEFFNKSINGVGLELRIDGRRAIEKLMGEVLGNAEDHSEPYSYWYVDGISFLEQKNDLEVVDLNFAIMNIGPSMFEGFEGTKEKNKKNYELCERLYDIHKSKFTLFNHFEKESLFTMYLLNDGISRLKYEDNSRGNGTIRFLEAFITLGSFGASDPRFKSELNVISGHTTLTCDNDMHAYKNDQNSNSLSLNKQKDIEELPDKEYLTYNKEYYPGTILECHIFLNKDFFEQTRQKNNENN